MAKTEYSEVSRAKVSDSRSVVISVRSKGGFTVAQQLTVNDGSNEIAVFLKGAIHVDNASGLYNLRDALNAAISYAESESNGINWDQQD